MALAGQFISAAFKGNPVSGQDLATADYVWMGVVG